MNNNIFLGILGCAHIHTKDYVKFILNQKNIKVISIWDHDRERAQKYCHALECIYVRGRGVFETLLPAR
jgi:predicted dehydrogenase